MPFFKSAKSKALHHALERKYISRPYLMSSDTENQYAAYIPIYNLHRPIRLVDARNNPEIVYRGHDQLNTPRPALADLIVDLVETGATLAENGLEIKEEIAQVSTLLIANRASYKLRREVLGPLVDALRVVTTPGA